MVCVASSCFRAGRSRKLWWLPERLLTELDSAEATVSGGVVAAEAAGGGGHGCCRRDRRRRGEFLPARLPAENLPAAGTTAREEGCCRSGCRPRTLAKRRGGAGEGCVENGRGGGGRGSRGGMNGWQRRRVEEGRGPRRMRRNVWQMKRAKPLSMGLTSPLSERV